MSSREFTESLVFERLEPDPASETVRLLGILVTLMHNVYRDEKRKPQPFTFDDFVHDPYSPTKAEREMAFGRIMAEYARHRKAKVN